MMEPPQPSPGAVTVRELLAGNEVRSGGMSAVFIASCPHPVWEALDLVVWVMQDGSVSLDALRPDQVVGKVVPSTPAARADRVRQALLDGVRDGE